MELIRKHKNSLTELCKKYNVLELYVFGSILTKNFKKDSDIDFVVRFGEVSLYDYYDNYIDFKESLEKLFKREIDLVEEQTIKNPILKESIANNKKIVYGRSDPKMAV